MCVRLRWCANIALLPVFLAGCAGSPPAPVAAGHPAHPATAPASPATLGILPSYRDFAQPRADQDTRTTTNPEQDDVHQH